MEDHSRHHGTRPGTPPVTSQTEKTSSSPRSRYIRHVGRSDSNAATIFHNDGEGVLSPAEWEHRISIMNEYTSNTSKGIAACCELFPPVYDFDMKFVNREEQVALFVSCLVETQYINSKDIAGTNASQRIIPFLDQMFGSGKTALAMKALECANRGLKWESPDDILEPVDDYGRAICQKIFKTSNLERLRQTATYQVDRRRILYNTIRSIISRTIFSRLKGCVDAISVAQAIYEGAGLRLEIQDRKSFVDYMHEFCANNPSILFIVDEVRDASVGQICNVWQFLVEQASILAKLQKPILLHIAFCGRQTLFLTLGKGSQSPTRIQWIPLPSLKLEHVKSIVKGLQEQKVNIFPKLTFRTDAVKDHFYKRLLDTTGGVPRILQYVLRALQIFLPRLNRNNDLEEEGAPNGIIDVLIVDNLEIDYIFDVVLFTGFCNKVPDRDKYCIDTSKIDAENCSPEEYLLEATLGALLLHTETGQEIDIDDIVSIDPNRRYTFGELLNYLPLFLESGNASGKVKLQRSQYVMRILTSSCSKSGSQLQSLLSFLSGLNRHGNDANITQDSALLFELILTSRMVQHIDLHLRQPKKPSEHLRILGLDALFEAETDWSIPQNTKLTIDVWPKVSSAHPPNETSVRAFVDRLVCTPQELAGEICRLITLGHNGVYVFIVRGKSKSGDTYVLNVNADKKIAVVMGIQAKSGEKDPIQLAKLKKEWKKFWETCPDQIPGIAVHYVLIVAAREFSVAVEGLLNSPALNGVLHLKSDSRHFASTLGEQKYLACVSRSLSSDDPTKNHGTVHHISSRGSQPTKLFGTRPVARSEFGRSIVELHTSENGKGKTYQFNSEISGFNKSDHKWTELEESTILPSDNNYHMLLWNEGAIVRFLDDEVWKLFNEIKKESDNPPRLVTFVNSLINGDRKFFNRRHRDSVGQPLAKRARFDTTRTTNADEIDANRDPHFSRVEDTYTVLHNFSGHSGTHLPAKQGESIRILSKHDSEWLEAMNRKGIRGLVPTSNVEKIIEWSVERAAEWLQSHPRLQEGFTPTKLTEYGKQFKESEIDGEELMNLRTEDLKDMGIRIVGHYKKIIRARDELFML